VTCSRDISILLKILNVARFIVRFPRAFYKSINIKKVNSIMAVSINDQVFGGGIGAGMGGAVPFGVPVGEFGGGFGGFGRLQQKRNFE